jgi:hypothetical protein
MFKRSAVMLALAALVALGTLARAAEDKPGSVKKPVAIAHFTDKVVVDGNADKWAAIKALPAPYSRKDAGMVKLAWREEGLYGYVQVPDDKVNADETNPWAADCIELWIEADFARADDMAGAACQLAIAPNPDSKEGKCYVVVAQGTISADAIKATWKKTDKGYALEFFIPATELKPAKFAEGTKIGLAYAVDDDGKAIEQFVADKDTDEGYKSPKTWGAIQFDK